MATISRARLKEIVKGVMTEESEYQTFFKKALEKAGKSITQMSDEEKKDFFNKIDAAWDGRGEKNEELVGNQSKLDIDDDGEIEASDLAALRAGEKKEEVVTEEFKHIIHVDTPTQIVSKPIAAQILALAKKGVRSKDIGLEMGFVGNAKLAADAFQKVKNKIYFELGKKTESVNEAKVIVYNEKTGERYEVLSGKGKGDLLIAMKALQKAAPSHMKYSLKESINETKFYAFFNNKKHEIEGKDLWDAKQKAITMLKVPKSKVGYLAIVNASEHDKGSFRYESVNEGRAFINAAKKAKSEKKTEFEFNGKKYPVTIKD